MDIRSTWTDSSLKIKKPSICGTYNAIDGTNDVTDNHGHGTHIAGIISRNAGNSDYCLMVLKYYDPKVTNSDNLKASTKAFKYAISQNVDIINYSGGGTEYDETECKVIKQALDKGISVVAAAGNEGKGFDKQAYYPAMCDSRILVVENIGIDGKRMASSNYGPDTLKAVGELVMSLMPNNKYGLMTGTSQATAVITGKLVKFLDNNRKLGSNLVTK